MASPTAGMVAHFYCMACGLLLPNTARSPSSSTRLQCPHCHCEMELPSLPSPGHPLLSPSSTTDEGSSSSVYSFAEGQHSELDGGVKDMRRLRLSSVGATDPAARAASPYQQSPSGGLKQEEEREADGSGDENEDGVDDSQNNSRNGSRRNSKAKKKRDPLAPKRAANAYMLFCKEQRPLLKIREPDLHFSVIGQRLGDMWRTLPVDDKKPYEDAAADDRDRYKSAMHLYTTSGIRSSMGERQLSGGDDGGPWSPHHGSPLVGGNVPHYAFHRPSDPTPFHTMPAALSTSNGASTSTPTSPYTYTPSTPSRYQPYPVHGSSANNYNHTYPGLSSSPSASTSGYAPTKRPRSYSRGAVEYGMPLDRSAMSEAEYFTSLYYYTVQQQQIINEEIRRYGRQRTQFAQLPVELQRQMMAQMGGLRGAQHDADMQAQQQQQQQQQQQMMPLPPPGYERGDSTASRSGGRGSGGLASPLPSMLPPFMPDLLDSSMEDGSGGYGHDAQQQQLNNQQWDFSEHMH